MHGFYNNIVVILLTEGETMQYTVSIKRYQREVPVMPPKQRVTREMILEKSFEMFRAEGMESINARSVAKTLNCSTQPIFSYFLGMGDLKSAIHDRAVEVFNDAIAGETATASSLEDFCSRYITFARNERSIFEYTLIAQDGVGSKLIENAFRRMVRVEAEQNGLTEEQSHAICKRMVLLAHGIAATQIGEHKMTSEQATDILSDVHKSLLANR